jgi:hypothetical protein
MRPVSSPPSKFGILRLTGLSTSRSMCGRCTEVGQLDDGEEHIDTVAAGWTGRNVYVRMSDTKYRLRAVWLDAADATRR